MADHAPASRPTPATAPAPRAGTSRAATAGPRKPSKFLADLTRAMQTAAESARQETLARLESDAKAYVEGIHARSVDGATDLRRRADDDVAAVREWSKAEVARIREETETRIAARKQGLESEIEQHGAQIERRVEIVQGRVAVFEAEMATFFDGLLAEEDPSRFASLAENLPEPPSFDDVDEIEADAATAEPETAMAAIQSAAEAAAADADSGDSVLGTPPDFAAAEAEAEALAGVGADDEVEVPVIGDAELAARLADLVPGDETASDRAEPTTTRVVVTGLVSVASIASFKRHLGRLDAVRSVAVSSGPEGDFVFKVVHGAAAQLGEGIPALSGFRARVTGTAEGVIDVAARDPDPEA